MRSHKALEMGGLASHRLTGVSRQPARLTRRIWTGCLPSARQARVGNSVDQHAGENSGSSACRRPKLTVGLGLGLRWGEMGEGAAASP